MELKNGLTTESTATAVVRAQTHDGSAAAGLGAVEIQTWLLAYLTELFGIDADKIDTTVTFDQYGLDSATAVGLTGDLMGWLNCPLDPAVVYEYPTIETLAQYLEGVVREQRAV